MQQEANAAVGTYREYKIQEDAEIDPNAIGKDAMKDLDTSTLKDLYKE